METMVILFRINALGELGVALGLLIYAGIVSRLSVAVQILVLAVLAIGCAS